MDKILLITLDYPPAWGGVSDYYAQLARHWPGGALDVLDNNDGRLWQARGGVFKWLKMLMVVARVMRRGRYQKVLVGQIIPLGWAAYVLRAWLSWIFKFEYGVFLHGLDFSLALKTVRRKWLTGRILRGARWIICANSYTAQNVREFLGDAAAERVKVVNPGVEVSEENLAEEKRYPSFALGMTERTEMTEYSPTILTVGRLVKRKGIDKMLSAMPEILKKYPRARYVVAGKGPELENWRDLAEELGLAHCVKFETEVEHNQKWRLYRECDVFVLPALDLDGDYEGFGIVYLEAGLMAKPVVAGRSGGVADAVVDGQTGLIVDVSQPEVLAVAVLKLLDNPDSCARMGQAGRERVLRDFTWDRQAGRVAEIVVE